MTIGEYYDAATAAARAQVEAAMAGRKGHGGGPCTRRVMTPAELEDFAIRAIIAYQRNVDAIQRVEYERAFS